MACSLFIASIIVFFFVSYTYGQQCEQTLNAARFNCYPEKNPTQEKCLARNCCWRSPNQRFNSSDFSDVNVPFCYYPSDFPNYEVISNEPTDFGQRIRIFKSQMTYMPHDILNLTVDFIYETEQRLRIRIYDSVFKRYEVPLKVPVVEKKADPTDYEIVVKSKPFSILVTRKSTGMILFDSSVSPLIFADQFIKISTRLSSPLLYGLGEHRQSLLINITENWQRLTFYTRDFPPLENINLYGVHPFHINLERTPDNQTKAHGQFLLNSNAMDVDLQPLPALTYTTIGGIIDLYILTGPTAHNVIEQYWDVIGKPTMPPFWSIGFHLCRWGYNNTGNLLAMIQRMHDAEFPYDVQWTDIDAMSSHLDFTYDNKNFNGLPDLVRGLQSDGKHYVNIIDPGISSSQPTGTYFPYDDGIKRGIFIKKLDSTDPILGQVWPGITAFPDFTNPDTVEWWTNIAATFHETIPFDGMWIDMNEPSSFIDGSINGCTTYYLDNPPFVPHVLGDSLNSKSLCPSAQQYLSSHYNLHNMYGYFEAQATNQALKTIRKQRPFVLSRSTFAGSGQFTAHWTGDNRATFNDMYFSIPAILNFNMFGITHVGADICGFGLDTTEELCTRWMQLGAFYPFMRNHNDIGQRDQDPASFSWEAQQIMKQALFMRYSLIPFWYTLHHQATMESRTILQPLFFEYINDVNTYNVDEQFLLGRAILVSPNLISGSDKVHAYFPADIWYELSSGVKLLSIGQVIVLNAPISKLNVHVRGGFIIPMQIPGANLVLGRGNPFTLLVAQSQSGEASGNLFWDDGDSLDSVETQTYNYFEFTLTTPNTLTVNALITNYKESPMRLDLVKILGINKPITSVTVNGKAYSDYLYDFLDQIFLVFNLMTYLSLLISSTIVFLVCYSNAQQCEKNSTLARFDCYPEKDPSKEKCLARSCCWRLPIDIEKQTIDGVFVDVPFCYYPRDFPTYEVTSNEPTDFGQRIRILKSQRTYMPNDILDLTADIIYETEQRLRIRIYDSLQQRYEVPLKVPVVEKKADTTDYEVSISEKPFSILVTRKSTGAILLDTSVSPLIFADQFIKISTRLSTPLLYGFGEHQQPLLINVTSEWKRLTFYTRDFPPMQHVNLYGVHPFHINLEKTPSNPNNVHGQFFLNSNAMDIDLQPLPALTYTTIGGIIDLYILTGPTVQNVIEQYWDVIGKPMMPPFWSLGFHLCRWGYNKIENIIASLQRMKNAEFPLDVQWTDIDTMSSYLDFTYDDVNFHGFPQLVRALQAEGMHYVNIIDPGISSTETPGSYLPYDDGVKRGIFMKKFNSTELIKGKVWPGITAFPDFTNPDTVEWWTDIAAAYHDIIPFDGMWIDMNEPSSFVDGSIDGCTDNSLDNPPFVPHVHGDALSAKTLCPSAQHNLSSHYNLHSMYGYFEAQATNQALKTIRKKRPFVLSRSTFAGSGQFTAHWTGDNQATFDDMYFSIPAIINFNMFGITHVGADICGFLLDTTEELCTRWMQLGAFYPFMRNHNSLGERDQDPASFSWEAQQIMKQALLMRYSLIPFWYTLHHQAAMESRTIVQSLFAEYLDDENTFSIDQQFLVGRAILVSPNLLPESDVVHAYIPKDVWYEFPSGVQLNSVGQFVDLHAPITKLNVHVRGGFIIPMQIPGGNLVLGRGNPFTLLAAQSDSGTASGNLFWDDGDSIDSIETKTYNYMEFSLTNFNKLTINTLVSNYKESAMRLDLIKILGVNKFVTSVTVNGKIYSNYLYNIPDQILLIYALDLDMLTQSSQTIQWTTSTY
ncbi:unnamed protein product [Rotaria socialis]|uniref:P-type domain-containing protein n=2 Tax=Rotaria socialis TaxID=392032 RepID=A0A820KHD4_9BILA|nr:unnamed protein product [Rotaria socialis]